MGKEAAPSYKRAGVDLEVADALVERLKPLAASTRTPGVESGLGSFGGFFSFPETGGSQLLVASIDGVGTKMKVARITGLWENAGYDIVSHCTDDILVHGGQPLFFLDYIGTAKLELDTLESLARGMTEACREAGCALLGGETAEMPGVYVEGEIDLVGCIIGAVQRDHLIAGEKMRSGDTVIGLASNGLHTNGYSLARRVLIEDGPGAEGTVPGSDRTVGEALAARHKMYLPAVKARLSDPTLHAMAHITGGGLPGNIRRVIPDGVSIEIDTGSWDIPPIFQMIQNLGKIDAAEMHHVFNMGIGWVVVVSPESADDWFAEFEAGGWQPSRIGRVVEGASGVKMI
jgi:phosphoribosylformylglycinamidine cyclo-ligase